MSGELRRNEDTDLELEKLEAAVEAVLFAMGDAVEVDKIAARRDGDYRTGRFFSALYKERVL